MIKESEFLKFIKTALTDQKFVVVTQKEPYIHNTLGKDIKEIKVEKAIGGVNVLLDSMLKKTGGFMFAMASGNADHLMVDKDNKLQVPPGNPSYTLRRIFLKEKDYKGFYNGFCNQTIWPLFHAVFIKPQFHASWWKAYQNVNKQFADAILAELKDEPAFIWINDFQFALLPKLLKKQRPDLKIGFFWHIPWPTHEVFRICPYRREMLEGLLASDFIGFHRNYQVSNFRKCVQRDLEVITESDPVSIHYKGHATRIAALPAGIDYDRIQERIKKNHIDEKQLLENLKIPWKQEKVIFSADRIDYTKGIVERLKIIDRFLERFEKFIGKVIFVSIGVPSRLAIRQYQAYNRRIISLAERINKKYKTKDWKPIHFLRQSLDRDELIKYYRISDVCMVTALDDGMNLISKEYIISNESKKGMLILSKFTGAAKDLKEAILINPFDVDGSAARLLEALTMKEKEKKERNEKMKKTLEENNVYKWAMDFIQHTLLK